MTCSTSTLARDAADIDLSVTKVGTPNPVQVGSPFDVHDRGPRCGRRRRDRCVVTDVPPAGHAASASPGCGEVAGTATCDVGAVGAGDDVALEIVVTPTTANPALVEPAAVDASTDRRCRNSATPQSRRRRREPRPRLWRRVDNTRGHAGHDPRADHDSDDDGDTLSAIGSGLAGLGHVLVHGTSCMYTPAATPTAPTRHVHGERRPRRNRHGGGTVTITPVDDPPVLAPVGDQVVAESATSVVTISAADVDGDPRTSHDRQRRRLPRSSTTVTHGQLTLRPGFEDAGRHGPVTITVTSAGATRAGSSPSPSPTSTGPRQPQRSRWRRTRTCRSPSP